ncbi:cysteine desulfurase NifS [Embleya scabrispora]|uniref:Cysteine desulfurase NifS n=1 Tax=Embleya scabrispora TaxID=159449 RepID=A0A1T3NW85_9ACTN|nr:cysteine desulfurase family protein [Embleya scabrispora]OPC81044.1 cysteine desulfurase NifS [Embleya scabrispora]
MAYFDHAATTPMRLSAIRAMTVQLAQLGNPSSLHASGRRARRTVEESRESLAHALGARPSEIVFTAGGTEADNLAIKGIYWSRVADDPARRRILVSPVEHHAVLDPVLWLESAEGAVVEWLDVDADGRVQPDTLRAAIERDPASVALVSVMWANNEVGTVEPIAELVEIAHEFGIPFHSDAVQAVGQIPVDFSATGLDAMTVTGHKLGGPGNCGALVLGRGITPVPVLHGGGQERDVRSGTLDTASIAALAVAAEESVREQAEYARRVGALRDELVRRILAAVPDAQLNGDRRLDPAHRLPGNAHFSFPGCEGDSLLLLLDARGIECSTGSACSAGVAQPSHVLLAMGADSARARGSLRFSLGHTTTEAEVAELGEAILPVVTRARSAGSVSARR